jgi:hypothetical protein
MKKLVYSIFCSIIFLNSCAQHKFEKPPKFPPKNYGKIKKAKPHPKTSYIFNLGDIKQNSDSLCCWKIDDECHIIDGETTIFSYYSYEYTDDASLFTYTYAKGEFLEGKYQGKWIFYDNKGRIIKKEKWDNGKLIYRKEFSFNQCNLKEKYKLSNIPNTIDYNSIEQFKKDFFIRNGKVRCLNGVISRMQIFFKNIESFEFIKINNGLPISHEINVEDAPVGMGNNAISSYYDNEGNLERMFFTEEKKYNFIKGSGHYVEYYTPVFNLKSQNYEPLIIKGKGEIRDNFKIGEWKYYDRNGKVDIIKTYSLNDFVDVRFPYCLFNKKEPGYANKK